MSESDGYIEDEKIRIPIKGKDYVIYEGKGLNPIKPTHYNGNKCMEIISEVVKDKPADEGFIIGNVIKYVFRYDKKGGVEDIKKAREYLTMLVEILEKK